MSQAANSNFDNFIPLIPGTKRPLIHDWPNVRRGTYTRKQCGRDAGIVLAAHELVLDFDPKYYPPGRDIWMELQTEYPELLNTKINYTKNGVHVYLLKSPDIRIKMHQFLYPGVEFKSQGHKIRDVGSKDDETGSEVFSFKAGPAIHIPRPFLALLQLDTYASDDKSIDAPTTIHEPQYIQELTAALPATEGDRNNGCFRWACRARDLGLSFELAFKHIRDIYGVKCMPQMDDTEIYKTVESAYTGGARSAFGNDTAEAAFRLVEAPAAPIDNVKSFQQHKSEHLLKLTYQQGLEYQLNKDGTVKGLKNTFGNLIWILQNDPGYKNMIRYNEFTGGLEFVGKPGWRQHQLNKGEALEQDDYKLIKATLSTTAAGATVRDPNFQYYGIECNLNDIEAACKVVGRANAYHPIKEYFESLQWDGITRLDDFLPETTGCDNKLSTRAIGRKTLIAAVKRIYEPGCKQDYVLILESYDQGTKKGMWIEALGKPWHSVGTLQKNNKDTYICLRGKWIIEIPEINDVLTKQSHAWLKAMITTATDTFRGLYERNASDVPRESIYIGTLNPGASNEYFHDYQNRRFLPIKARHLKVERLEELRDQLFAEAVHCYKNGEKSWIDNEAAWVEIRADQAARIIQDPWKDYLSEWAARQQTFLPRDVFAALGFTPKDVSGSHRTRIYNILRELGYEFHREIGGGMWQKVRLNWSDVL